MFNHAANEFGDLLGIAHVTDLRPDGGAAFRNIVTRALQLRCVPRADGELASLVREIPRQLQAQAPRTSGNQGYAAAQIGLMISPQRAEGGVANRATGCGGEQRRSGRD
jgi:hypothetical protein